MTSWHSILHILKCHALDLEAFQHHNINREEFLARAEKFKTAVNQAVLKGGPDAVTDTGSS